MTARRCALRCPYSVNPSRSGGAIQVLRGVWSRREASRGARGRKVNWKTVQTFKISFRRDNFVTHHRKQHPAKFAEFDNLSYEKKKSFFLVSSRNESKKSVPLRSVPRSTGRLITATVSSGIVDVINRFYAATTSADNVPGDDDEAMVHEDFELLAEGEYLFTIHDVKQFETVVECPSTVASFSSIAQVFQIFEKALGTSTLGRPCEQSISRDVRHLAALNLAVIRDVLNSVWGFSILVDGSTYKEEGYLDVRLLFELECRIHNIYLMGIPVGDALPTTPNDYADSVLYVLERISGPAVLAKLTSVTTDSAASRLGCRQEFALRIRHACEKQGGKAIMVNWCGSHQLNEVVLGKSGRVGRISVATRERNHLRSNVHCGREAECLSFPETQWESINDTWQFLAAKYDELVNLRDAKGKAQSSSSWWLSLFLVAKISTFIHECLKQMQLKTLPMEEQSSSLNKLAHTIQALFQIDVDNTRTVCASKVQHQITTASYHLPALFGQLGKDENVRVVDGWRQAIEVLIEQINKISIELNEESTLAAPNRSLRTISYSIDQFAAQLHAHDSRLEAHFGRGVCDKIWKQWISMVDRYAADQDFKERVDGTQSINSLEHARDAIDCESSCGS